MKLTFSQLGLLAGLALGVSVGRKTGNDVLGLIVGLVSAAVLFIAIMTVEKLIYRGAHTAVKKTTDKVSEMLANQKTVQQTRMTENLADRFGVEQEVPRATQKPAEANVKQRFLFCPKCGNPRREGTKFCTQCGNAFPE